MSVNLSPITGSQDLFGKVAADLQSNVAVTGTNITGHLNYVSDYTGFSSKVEEQSGNYLAVHAEANVEGATITVKVTKPVTLDPDGDVVLRIADKSTQTVTVVASKEGYDSVTKVYNLTGLTVDTE